MRMRKMMTMMTRRRRKSLKRTHPVQRTVMKRKRTMTTMMTMT